MVRASFIYIFIAIYVLVLAPPAMLWTFLAKDTRIIYTLARFCIRTSGILAGIRVQCEGRDKILPGQTYLFLSNHQGNFDGPVLCHSIPRNWKALIKKEMMGLPVLSFVLRQVQFVPIERTNPQRARLAIDHGAEMLASGNSFIAFPEGTRSRDGTLGAFKKGAFIMALKSQTPVMPVTILGSASVQPPGSYAVNPGNIRVIFHDPISTEGMNTGERDKLIEQTRKAIASRLPLEHKNTVEDPRSNV